MDTSIPRFQYKLLPPRHIRLFVLLPGCNSSPLRGSLYEADISNRRACDIYKAVSYTWGNSTTTLKLHIANNADDLDDRHIKITESLSDALQHLRPLDVPLTLWIDQICIDQSNTSEKEEQIGLMPQIYLYAADVLAWLGPSADGSDVAMDMLEQTDWVNFVEEARRLDEASLHELLEGDGQTYHCLNQLRKRPWWTRTWILHEATAQLPSRTWIICESKRVLLEKFLSVLSTLQFKRSERKSPAGLEMLSATIISMIRAIRRFQELRELPNKPPLFDLIRRTVDSEVSDPRDKIYCMVGFSKEAYEDGPQIQIDYSCPPLETYVNCTLWYISKYKCLDFFAYHSHAKLVDFTTRPPVTLGRQTTVVGSGQGGDDSAGDPSKAKPLPSWALPWTRVRFGFGLSEFNGKARPLFQACGRYRSAACDTTRRPARVVECLSVLGIGISTIASVLRDPGNPESLRRNPHDAVRRWEPQDQERLCSLSGLEIGSVFKRTITADLKVFHDGNGTPLRWCRWDDGMRGDAADERSDEAVAIRTVCLGRRLFYTKAARDGTPGFMGLAPRRVSLGDEVWILQGCRVPVILRPQVAQQDDMCGSMNLQTGTYEEKYIALGDMVYEFIGEGFVLGLMDGEVEDMLGSPPKRPRPPPLQDMDTQFHMIGIM